MAGPLPLSITGAPLAGVADPNGTAPGSLTTWTTPPHTGSGDDATALELELVDGTSATVELWVWVQGTEWALEGSVTLAAPHQVSAPVGAFGGGAIIYPRVTAAAGNPTTVRGGFTRPLPGAGTATIAGAVTVSASALPAGAATSALQGTTFDTDSGAGTQNVAGVSLRKSANGGSVELGTSADPVRVDPTGTTTQPTARRLASAVTDSPQQSITTKAALTSLAVNNRLIVQADYTNTTNVRVGPDATVAVARGVQLAPGEAWEFYVSNANALSAIAESGTCKLNVLAE